jgi:hypothetical protein
MFSMHIESWFIIVTEKYGLKVYRRECCAEYMVLEGSSYSRLELHSVYSSLN